MYLSTRRLSSFSETSHKGRRNIVFHYVIALVGSYWPVRMESPHFSLTKTTALNLTSRAAAYVVDRLTRMAQLKSIFALPGPLP
jgi:hypothetical protein